MPSRLLVLRESWYLVIEHLRDAALDDGRFAASTTIMTTTGGTIYGMVKTTLYLPDDLKRSVEAEAARRGESEAEVIRGALRQALPPVARRPQGGLFAGKEPIAARVDELLTGFGE